MKKKYLTLFALTVVSVFAAGIVFESTSFARVGGGRSSGSRGSRSYSSPSRPSSSGGSSYERRNQQRQDDSRRNSYQQQPAQQGGFMRNLGGGILGGIAGGLLGGMLMRSMGMGGGMGGGMPNMGCGFGIFEFIILAGIIYVVYRIIKSRRREQDGGPQLNFQQMHYQGAGQESAPRFDSTPTGGGASREEGDLDRGLGFIHQMDGSFDESRFRDQSMDFFFKLQGASMARDIGPVSGQLTDEMKRIISSDIDEMKKKNTVNKLENIAVREVDITEAWQESGFDFITVRFYANLLDYTVDATSGAVVSGSTTEPVKFEEFWTFTRKVGPGSWALSAIEQA